MAAVLAAPAFRPALIIVDSTAVSAASAPHASQAQNALENFQNAIKAIANCTGPGGAPPPAVPAVSLFKREQLICDVATAAVPSLSAPAQPAAAPAKGKKDTAATVATASLEDIYAAANAVTPDALLRAVVRRVEADFTKHCLSLASAELDRRNGSAGGAAPIDPKAKGGKPTAPSSSPALPVDPALQAAFELLHTRYDLTAAGAPTHLYILLNGCRTPAEAAVFAAGGSALTGGPGLGMPMACVNARAHPSVLLPNDAQPVEVAPGAPADLAAFCAAVQWDVPAPVPLPLVCAIRLTVPPPPPSLPGMPVAVVEAPAAAVPGGKGGAGAGKDAKKADAKGASAPPSGGGKGGAEALPASPAPPTPLEQVLSCVDARLAWGYTGPTGAELLGAMHRAYGFGVRSMSVAELSAALHVPCPLLAHPPPSRPSSGKAGPAFPPAASFVPVGPHPFGGMQVSYVDIRDLPCVDLLLPTEAGEGGHEDRTVTYTAPPAVAPPTSAAPGKGGPAPPSEPLLAPPLYPRTVPILSPEGMAAVLLQRVNGALQRTDEYKAWVDRSVVRMPSVPHYSLAALASLAGPPSSSPSLASAAAAEYMRCLHPLPPGAIGVATVLFAAAEAVATASAALRVPFPMPTGTRVWVPTLSALPTGAASQARLDSDGADGRGVLVVDDPAGSGCSSSGRVGGVPPMPGLLEGPLAEELMAALKVGNGDLLSLGGGAGGEGDPVAPCDAGAGPAAGSVSTTALVRPRVRWVMGGACLPLSVLIEQYRENVRVAAAWYRGVAEGAPAFPVSDPSLFRLSRAAAAAGVAIPALYMHLPPSSPSWEGGGRMPLAALDRLVLLSCRPHTSFMHQLLLLEGASGRTASLSGVADAAADMSEFSALSTLPRDVISRTLLLRSAEALLQAADTAVAARYVSDVESREMCGSEAGELHQWRLGGWAWAEGLDEAGVLQAMVGVGAGGGHGSPTSLALAGRDPTSGALVLALHTPVPRRRVQVSVGDPADLISAARCVPGLVEWGGPAAAPGAGLLDLGCRVPPPSTGSASPAPASAVVHAIYPADRACVTLRQPLLRMPAGEEGEGEALSPSHHAALAQCSISATKDGHTFGLRLGERTHVFVAHFGGDGGLGAPDVSGPSCVTVHAHPVSNQGGSKKRRASKGAGAGGRPSPTVDLTLGCTLSEGLHVRVSTRGWIRQEYIGARTLGVGSAVACAVPSGSRSAAGEPWVAQQFPQWPAWLVEISREHCGSTGTLVRRFQGGAAQVCYEDGATAWFVPPSSAVTILGDGLEAALAGHSNLLAAAYVTKCAAAREKYEREVLPAHANAHAARVREWEERVAALQAAAASAPPLKKGAPPVPELPMPPEQGPPPPFVPPPPLAPPHAATVLACVEGMWVDVAANGSRRVRILLRGEAVSAYTTEDRDAAIPSGPIGGVPTGVPVMTLPLPPVLVHTAMDPGTCARVRVRYDSCPLPDPLYAPPPPSHAPTRPLYRKGAEVARVIAAQERVNGAVSEGRREALGGLWAGLECDGEGTPVWDGRGSGPAKGRVATAVWPGPGRGRTLTLHSDGTHIASDPGAHRITVACRGWATVEHDSAFGAVADAAVRGAKAQTAASGPRTRSVTTLPDGTLLCSDYDASVTARVHARLRLHRPDGICVSATDDGLVQYRPMGVGGGGGGEGGYSSDGSTGTASGGSTVRTGPLSSSLVLGCDPHADLMDGSACTRSARGLSPQAAGGAYTFHTLTSPPVRRVRPMASGLGAVMETIDPCGNYFAVLARDGRTAVGGGDPTADRNSAPSPPYPRATHLLLCSVICDLAGCVLPPNRSIVPRLPLDMHVQLHGEGEAGGRLTTVAVPGAPPGTAVVVPRVEEPLPPTLFVLGGDGSGCRLIGPREWALTALLAAGGGGGHGRLGTDGGTAEWMNRALEACGRVGEGVGRPPSPIGPGQVREVQAAAGVGGGAGYPSDTLDLMSLRGAAPRTATTAPTVTRELVHGARDGTASLSAHGPPPSTQVFIMAPTRGDPLLLSPTIQHGVAAAGSLSEAGNGAPLPLPTPMVYSPSTPLGCGLVHIRGRDCVKTTAAGWIIPRPGRVRAGTVAAVFGRGGLDSPLNRARVSRAVTAEAEETKVTAELHASISGMVGPAGVAPPRDFSLVRHGGSGAVLPHAHAVPGLAGGAGPGVAALVGEGDEDEGRGGDEHALSMSMADSQGSLMSRDTVGGEGDAHVRTLARALKARYSPTVFIAVPELLCPPWDLFTPSPLSCPCPPMLLRTWVQTAQLGGEERALLLAQERVWMGWRLMEGARARAFACTDPRSHAHMSRESTAAAGVLKMRADTGTAPARRKAIIGSLQKMAKAAGGLSFIKATATAETTRRDAESKAADDVEEAASLAVAGLELARFARARGGYTPRPSSRTPSPSHALSSAHLLRLPTADGASTALLRVPSRDEMGLMLAGARAEKADARARADAEDEGLLPASMSRSEASLSSSFTLSPSMMSTAAPAAARVGYDTAAMAAAQRRRAQARDGMEVTLAPSQVGAIRDYGTGVLTLTLDGVKGGGGAKGRVVHGGGGEGGGVAMLELDEADEAAADPFLQARKAAEEDISTRIASRIDPSTGKSFERDSQRRMRIGEMKAWERAWTDKVPRMRGGGKTGVGYRQAPPPPHPKPLAPGVGMGGGAQWGSLAPSDMQLSSMGGSEGEGAGQPALLPIPPGNGAAGQGSGSSEVPLGGLRGALEGVPSQRPASMGYARVSEGGGGGVSSTPGSTVGVHPAAAQYGDVRVGRVHRFTLSLHNLGQGPLRFRVDRAHAAIAGITGAGAQGGNAVKVVADSAPIARSASRSLLFELDARTPGLFTDTVQIITPAETLSIPVSGRVLAGGEGKDGL